MYSVVSQTIQEYFILRTAINTKLYNERYLRFGLEADMFPLLAPLLALPVHHATPRPALGPVPPPLLLPSLLSVKVQEVTGVRIPSKRSLYPARHEGGSRPGFSVQLLERLSRHGMVSWLV